MKKATLIAALSLAVALFAATSAFAGIIWSTGADATLYGESENELGQPIKWTSGPVNVSGTQGSGPLLLTLGITATDLSGSTMLFSGVKGAGSTSNAWAILADGTWTGYVSTPVILNPSGMYAFDAVLKSGEGATWKLNSATLSKTPIPAAALLLGSGFLGLVGLGKARRKDKKA